MFAQMLLQQLVGNTAAPELVSFGFIFRPWRFLTAQLDRLVALKIYRLLQKFFYLGHPLINTFGVQSVDVVSRFQGAKKNISSDRIAVFCAESVNVLLCKKEVTVIEQLQIRLQEFFRNLLVKLLTGIMAFLQEAADRHGDCFLRRRHRRWRGNRSCQNDGE